MGKDRAANGLEAARRIERATNRLNELVGQTSLELAVAIGRVIIEELYGGSLEQWHRRGPKEHSLRRLAANPQLHMSASTLFRALGIYEIKRRMPDHPMWDTLSVCHFRAVLGLPASEQERLLDLALEQRWTTSAMAKAAGKSRTAHKASRGGRPRKPRFARSIESAERALADENVVFGDIDALAQMSAEQRADLERRLSLVRRRCDELASFIEA